MEVEVEMEVEVVAVAATPVVSAAVGGASFCTRCGGDVGSRPAPLLGVTWERAAQERKSARAQERERKKRPAPPPPLAADPHLILILLQFLLAPPHSLTCSLPSFALTALPLHSPILGGHDAARRERLQ